MTVDVVILAYTLDREVWEMNAEAIRSLRASEPDIEFNVCLVESNPDWESVGGIYDPFTQVLVPNEKFNFNRFNNLGMAQGNAEWVIFANNDVVFHPGWCRNMLKAAAANPKLMCLCPVDPKSQHTPEGTFSSANPVPGYLVRVHFTGWCFMVRREIFDVVGKFDERFDYYFADDDFTLTLRKYDLLNAVVPSAKVNHLAHITSQKSQLDISEKFHEDQEKFHAKWGSQRLLGMKSRLSDYVLHPLGMKGIIDKLYRSN